jgi:hypothetical protein
MKGNAQGCGSAAASREAFARGTASAHAEAFAAAITDCDCVNDAMAIAESSELEWKEEFSSKVSGAIFTEACVESAANGQADTSSEALLLCVQDKYAYVQARVCCHASPSVCLLV